MKKSMLAWPKKSSTSMMAKLLLFNRHFGDQHIFQRMITTIFVGSDSLNFLYHLVTAQDFPENSVLAIKPGSGLGRDNEKLGTISVRPRISHSERTARHFHIIDFISENIAGTTCSMSRPIWGIKFSIRITTLDHEIFNHSMEQRVIVETLICQGHEILHCFWSFVFEEF